MKLKISITLLVIFQVQTVLADFSCVDCHDDVIGEKTVVHKAAETCTNCHKKHTGNVPGEDKPDPSNPLRLKKLGNALCFNCHEMETEADHPTANHPIARETDPLYPEKPFGCISCHNPHASNMPAMFRYNYSKSTVYNDIPCAVCHWDMYSGGRRAPKRPDWKTGE